MTNIEMKQTANDNQYIPARKLLTRRKATAGSLCHRLGVTVRCPYDFMCPARASCGDLAGSLRLSQESTIILGHNDNLNPALSSRSPCGARTGIVRCHCDVSTSYGLTIFSNLSLCGVKQNRRGHDARKSVR